MVTRGGVEHEINTHGQAGWQGIKYNSRKDNRGLLDRGVNKKAM